MSTPPAGEGGRKSLLPEDFGPDTQVFDRRAVAVGLLVSAGLVLLALVWRLAPTEGLLKRIEEFEFKVLEPKAEEFTLKDPIRDILRERKEEPPDKVEEMETPDIRISENPQPVVTEQAVVQSRQVEIETPRIEIAATELDIPDTPMEISETSEDTAWALNVIAADSSAPADIFKYSQPTPPDKMALYLMNAAPVPGRSAKVLRKAFGDQDAPTLGELGPASINLFGVGDYFRSMERAGGAKAKAAVDGALHWLAIHQEQDGMWDAARFEGDKSANAAVTGLAALALMGGGHTTRKGEYRRTVLKALEALMRCQGEDGRVAWEGANMYTHALCAIALCEAYGRARDERVGAAAQRAATFCEKAVNADGGWRYVPKSDSTDMSVTAWFVQALKTAKIAQLKVSEPIYAQALVWVDGVTDKGASRDSTGAVTYQYAPDQNYPGNSFPALTCAGMMIRQFTGMGVRNHILVKAAELTKSLPPQWDQKDFYYWYYATYAMHNMGGEFRLWWNQRIRDTLLQHQAREGDNAGSWDPKGDKRGDRGGRVYVTALGALCLEVYYRYGEALTSFGVAPDLDELFFE